MTKRVTELSIPSVSLRNDALHAVDHGESYGLWAAKFGCLNELQLIPGKSMERASGILRIGAWNLERGRDWSAASQLIREQGLDVVLLSEMDCGMSRSLQAHTTQQLAQELGWHGLFAVEFVELELGNAWELATPTELENAAGLHGNAIISRFPLKTPWLHRFRQSDGSWWHRQFHEPRLGGRIALGAILETDIGDIQIMTTHLENDQGPDDRAEALAELFQAQLDHRPCVFGGDLNTSTFTQHSMQIHFASARSSPQRLQTDSSIQLLMSHCLTSHTSKASNGEQAIHRTGHSVRESGDIRDHRLVGLIGSW